jgi:hypothetical protein
MRRRILCFSALALALVWSATGCGGARPVPVSGTVTLDGQPVDAATVVFIPKEGKGRQASGLTGTDGKFRLTTSTTGDGALPGEYVVLVTRAADTTVVAQQVDVSNPQEAMKQMMKTQPKGKKAPPPPKSLIPKEYGDQNKSPLKATVPTTGEVQLALRSQGGS